MLIKLLFISTFVLHILGTTNCLKLPFDICPLNKPDTKDCLIKSTDKAVKLLYKGIPELNTPNLDVLKIKELTIGSNDGPISLQQKYKDLSVEHEGDLHVTDVNLNKLDEKTLGFNVTGFYEKIIISGDYEIVGKMLVFSLNGNGKMALKFFNTTAKLDFILKQHTIKNKSYYKLEDIKLFFIPSLVTYNFENLVPNNKQLSDEILKVMNENWHEIFKQGHEGYAKAIGSIMGMVINKVFTKVPAEEVFLN